MTDSAAQLTLQETRLLFGGVVHFDNAQKVCDDGLKLLRTAPKAITIDMSQLQSSSSVVVAILVSWLRAASQYQQTLQFCHMPQKLRAIISVSGLTDVFPQAI
jgi:anti-anti-sigma regulatory factor